MSSNDFQGLCRSVLKTQILNEQKIKVDDSQIHFVWLSKILQNNKAIVITTLPDEEMYEFTYNGNKEELYVDRYVKQDNRCYTGIEGSDR